MNDKRGYTGIDWFRLLAAFLVVAIHTSPLASFCETGDFILTRIAARIGVPFFFTTSGFFLFSEGTGKTGKLKAFLKRTAILYAAAILLYLPVNFYTGYFRMDCFLPNLIKDLVFDGTFYHLWYLPASMAGAAIAWLLMKRFGCGISLTVTLLLYAAGLLGDSYYGIAEGLPLLQSLYRQLFLLSDYTRNGIFFAPVFFVLGGMLREKQGKEKRNFAGTAAGISFAAMVVEALLLKYFSVQRHDSMYLCLLPCTYFLFQFLITFRGKRIPVLGRLSLLIYLLHPMMILAVRLTGKLLHLETLLIENSLIHYLLVCAGSLVVSAIFSHLWRRRTPAKVCPETKRAYLEISLDHLEHNVKALQSVMQKNCQLMAVIKANAYGHGAYETAFALNRMGIRSFAVAEIEEAIRLRKDGIRGEILILGYTDPSCAAELKKYDLMQTVIDFDYAKKLNEQKIPVKVHLKIDTGMHRLGIPDEDFTHVRMIFRMKYLNICGIYTHLCCPDSQSPEDVAFTRGQIGRFYRITDALQDCGIRLPKLHIQSSYGLFNYPELPCDYVRAGIALYGVLSDPEDEIKRRVDLRPVLSIKARVALIRTVNKGESVGYGRAFTAERNSRIAILSIGYGDGIPRSLSYGKGSVLIGGKRAPIVGRICMDQMAVDITEIENVSPGDIAVIVSNDPGTEMTAPELAKAAETISNELLCRVGPRLPVITV